MEVNPDAILAYVENEVGMAFRYYHLPLSGNEHVRYECAILPPVDDFQVAVTIKVSIWVLSQHVFLTFRFPTHDIQGLTSASADNLMGVRRRLNLLLAAMEF